MVLAMIAYLILFSRNARPKLFQQSKSFRRAFLLNRIGQAIEAGTIKHKGLDQYPALNFNVFRDKQNMFREKLT